VLPTSAPAIDSSRPLRNEFDEGIIRSINVRGDRIDPARSVADRLIEAQFTCQIRVMEDK
jgi:hypothetical protein